MTQEEVAELVAGFFPDAAEQKLIDWKMDNLEAAGFEPLHASVLAVGDSDWRRAIELVKQGWTHRQALGATL